MCLSISVEMGGKVDVGIDKTRHDRHSGQVIGDRAPEPVDPGDLGPVDGDPRVLDDPAGAVEEAAGPNCDPVVLGGQPGKGDDVPDQCDKQRSR